MVLPSNGYVSSQDVSIVMSHVQGMGKLTSYFSATLTYIENRRVIESQILIPSENTFFKGLDWFVLQAGNQPIRFKLNTIIGIDPGLASTGIGIVWGEGLSVSKYAFGTIYTKKEDSLARRLAHIYEEVFAVLENRKPDLMIVEDVFSLEKYPKSGIALGKVCGVILLAGHKAGLETIEIPVREAKKILTGSGKASKEQLEKSVRKSINRKTRIGSFHASDALGLALIGLFRYGGDGIFNGSNKSYLQRA